MHFRIAFRYVKPVNHLPGVRHVQLPMHTIFSIDSAVLGRLDAVSATRTFRNLLWCEAWRSGLSPHKMVISLRTNVSDGGIDARVDGPPTVDSILVRGTTFFQVKVA
jgi:hypothetical protein